jgi:hypothetical protein
LTTNNDKPNDDIHPVVEDTFEHPFFVVNLSCVEHVENLEPHKHIENIGELSAGTPFSFLEDVLRGLIEVVGSTRVNVAWAVGILEFCNGFREPVFSSKDNGVNDGNLVNGVTKEMLNHFSGNNVFISSVGSSLKQVLLGWFGSQSKSTKGVHNQIDPQELDRFKRRVLEYD